MNTLRSRGCRLALALGTLSVLSLPPQAHAQSRQKYTVTMQDEVAGAMHAATDERGNVAVDFSYRNNGRGPDLKEQFSLDALGTPVAYVPVQVYEALGIRPFSSAASIVSVEPR